MLRPIIRIIGLGWAAIGAYIMYTVSRTAETDAGLGLVLVLTFLVFILPGLLLAK